jgi:hypothetical protein
MDEVVRQTDNRTMRAFDVTGWNGRGTTEGRHGRIQP